ncbi:I78 family peptidase inhibitor [Pseudomonas sp. F1_0610]|uniref:I78 family peptidase inhibitor n=1 Tax=Pseudomonas sp. F1_0610 TaxID=3114284 RepID=UPI0039C35B67
MFKSALKLAVLGSAMVLLNACTTNSTSATVASAGHNAKACAPAPAKTLVGQTANLSDLVIKEKTGAKTIRRLEEGSPMTMDYDAQRISIITKGDVIVDAICG